MMSWKQIRESEPIRVWIYPLLIALLGIATQQGIITADSQGAIQGLLMAVLGVGAVEGVRGRVSPVRPAQHLLVNPRPEYGKHERIEDDGPPTEELRL